MKPKHKTGWLMDNPQGMDFAFALAITYAVANNILLYKVLENMKEETNNGR